MLLLIAALAVATQAPATATDSDPVVCKREKSADVGTHMRPERKCLKKSEWDYIEKNTQKGLQAFRDRSSFDPGRADSGRPH